MTVQITIIGLGQVGSSIGLALAEHKNIKRIGHDKDVESARAAQKAGAVDETKYNLPASVSGSKLVLLCLPLAEIRKTMEVIAPDLEEGAVIMDTAPAKAMVAAWVKELLPAGRHYVGLSPAAGVGHLHGIDFGVSAARADLFKDGLFMVNAPYGTPEEAVKLAIDLISLLGAQTMLTDEVEADGLLASTHILPQLISAALIDATIDRPGWQEARKLAARPFAGTSAGVAYHDDVDSLSAASVGNRENVARVLDNFMVSLKEVRDKITAGDEETLTTFLVDAHQARVRWIDERHKADWEGAQAEKPDFPSMGERLLGGLFSRPKKSK